MSDTLKEIEVQAHSLLLEERARLAESLPESLRDAPIAEIEKAWEAEIAERVAAYDRGDLPTFSAESVFAEARRLARFTAAVEAAVTRALVFLNRARRIASTLVGYSSNIFRSR